MSDPLHLLSRCLPHLYEALFGVIDCDSTLIATMTGEIVPVPRTMDSLSEAEARRLVQLIREVEGLVGKAPSSLTEEWLRDVIDGRGDWKYLVEEKV